MAKPVHAFGDRRDMSAPDRPKGMLQFADPLMLPCLTLAVRLHDEELRRHVGPERLTGTAGVIRDWLDEILKERA